MTTNSTGHRPSGVDSVRVSEATRRDAKPPKMPQFASAEDEYNYLVATRIEIERELEPYSKSNMQLAKNKAFARSSAKQASAEWKRIQSTMLSERTKLIKRKTEIDQRITVIRGQRNRERDRQRWEHGTVTQLEVSIAILQELREIKEALVQRTRSGEDTPNG